MSTLLVLALLVQLTPPAEGETIVVRARRAQDELAACLARNCPPAEEIDASLNAGVDYFRAGEYTRAKDVLARAVARNRRHAAALPGPVSTLFATYADVAEQEGDDRIFRSATRDSVAVLREHVGENSLSTLLASRRIGDMLVRLGEARAADDAYRAVQARSVEAGQPRLAAELAFRRAWLALSVRNYDRALALGEDAKTLAGRDDRGIAAMINVLATRVAVARGDETAVDRLVAELRTTPGAKPVLISSQPYPPVGAGTPTETGRAYDTGNPTDQIGAANDPLFSSDRIDWVDIGFWIRPGGETADAQILRGSDPTSWARPLLSQIASRRYSAAAADSPVGLYRVERFTSRPSIGQVSGSRIQRRVGERTLHVVDLSDATGAP